MSSSAWPTNDVVLDISNDGEESLNDSHPSSSMNRGDISVQRPRIFRVPPHLRENDRKAYEPKLVSLGPYHQGKKRLSAMGQRKRRYLDMQLARNNALLKTDYIREMEKLEPEARSCYSEQSQMSNDQFAQMLLLDGSFVVQFLIMMKELNEGGNEEPTSGTHRLKLEMNERDRQDPTTGTAWFPFHVCYDMLLLENQLPFFVLQKLYDMSKPSSVGDLEFSSLVLSFFGRFHGINVRIPESTDPAHDFHHLLHLFHKSIIPPHHQNPETNPNRFWDRCFNRYRRLSSCEFRMRASIPNAVKLKLAGIRFKKNEQHSLPCVTFRNGVVEMSLLTLHDSTGSNLKNLIAFEQCHPESGMYLASYAKFMECLVLSREDVDILQKHGVLLNLWGKEEAAAQLLHHLGKEVVLSPEESNLENFFMQVNQYYSSKDRRWRAELCRQYFPGPWTLFDFIKSIIVLQLTIVGTMYAVLSYRNSQVITKP